LSAFSIKWTRRASLWILMSILAINSDCNQLAYFACLLSLVSIQTFYFPRRYRDLMLWCPFQKWFRYQVGNLTIWERRRRISQCCISYLNGRQCIITLDLEVNRKRSINPLSRLPSANNLGINWVWMTH
jgi:hypothetical protein